MVFLSGILSGSFTNVMFSLLTELTQSQFGQKLQRFSVLVVAVAVAAVVRDWQELYAVAVAVQVEVATLNFI